ncbi:MAG: sulfotransferase domain-containing protein [Myxococcota bacterium]
MRVRGFFKPRLSILGERYSPLEWYRNHRADAFVLSFPKTGRTWLRLMMHRALSLHLGVTPTDPLEFHDFTAADPRVPRIRVIHDDEPHWRHPHTLHESKERYRGKRVILLVRDPRDAIVSLWFQNTKRWKVFDKSLHEFLWQSRGSLRSMVRFYNIWAANRHVPRELLLVRYEGMHADPVGTLRNAMALIGVDDVPDRVLVDAIEENRIDALRQREASLRYGTKRLRPGDLGDPESFKARKGKVGGYAEYLSPEDIRAANELINRELDPWYGYEV